MNNINSIYRQNVKIWFSLFKNIQILIFILLISLNSICQVIYNPSLHEDLALNINELPFNLSETTVYEPSVKLEITQEAIDLFLLNQYNDPSFNNEIYLEEYDVTITLFLPEINLNEDQISITWAFKIQDDFYEITDFNINLLPYEINVQIISEDFEDYVNGLDIEEAFKVAIIEQFNDLELEIYPQQLAEMATDNVWIRQRGLNIVYPYFSLAWDIDPGVINLIFKTHVGSEEPNFLIYLHDEDPNWSIYPYYDFVSVEANIEVNIVEVRLYNYLGQLIASNDNVNIVCPKNGQAFVPLSPIETYIGYLVTILYEIDHTFYVRRYSVWSADAGYYENSTWFFSRFQYVTKIN